MSEIPKHSIFPISDAALTIDFGNVINEDINSRVLSLFHSIKAQPFTGMVEVVPAYSSLTIYYDPYRLRKLVPANQTVYNWVLGQVVHILNSPHQKNGIATRDIEIPVCYEKEYAPDIETLARKKNISIEEIIQIHTAATYRVYMLGFLPGFSYLGEVDERIAISRKSRPAQVAEGSVGIAGRQTGIYPMACPGGWQVIGRTPLKLFRIEKGSSIPENGEKAMDDLVCLLQPGDNVRFISISKNEFENY